MDLTNKINRLEHLVAQMERQNTKVSSRPVGWHIDHSLKVILKTCEAVKKSDPQEYRRNFNLVRFLVFTLKSFPRGRANAPKSVVADGEISEKDLRIQLAEAKAVVNELQDLPVGSNFKHPFFGMLKLNQIAPFLCIHTHHHIKIIDDIVKN